MWGALSICNVACKKVNCSLNLHHCSKLLKRFPLVEPPENSIKPCFYWWNFPSNICILPKIENIYFHFPSVEQKCSFEHQNNIFPSMEKISMCFHVNLNKMFPLMANSPIHAIFWNPGWNRILSMEQNTSKLQLFIYLWIDDQLLFFPDFMFPEISIDNPCLIANSICHVSTVVKP